VKGANKIAAGLAGKQYSMKYVTSEPYKKGGNPLLAKAMAASGASEKVWDLMSKIIEVQLPSDSDDRFKVKGLYDRLTPIQVIDLIAEQIIADSMENKNNLPDADSSIGTGSVIDYLALIRHSLDTLDVLPDLKLENDPSEHLRVILGMLVEQLRGVQALVLSFPSSPMLSGLVSMMMTEIEKLEDAKRPKFKFEERKHISVTSILPGVRKILESEKAGKVTVGGVDIDSVSLIDIVMGLANKSKFPKIDFPKIPDAFALHVLKHCMPVITELNLPKLELADIAAMLPSISLPSVQVPGAGLTKLIPKNPDFWIILLKGIELMPSVAREFVSEITWCIYAGAQHRCGRYWLWYPSEYNVLAPSSVIGSIYNKTGKGSRKSMKVSGSPQKEESSKKGKEKEKEG